MDEDNVPVPIAVVCDGWEQDVPFSPQLKDPGNGLPLAVALSWIEGVEPLHSVVSGEASTDTELSIETVTVPDPAQVGLLRSVTFTM